MSYLKVSKVSQDNLSNALTGRSVAAFIGAGLSIGAGLPGWHHLIRDLLATTSIKLPPKEWVTGDILIDAAQAYINERGLHSMISFLKDKLDTTRIAPTSAHQALVKLPISLIITTNYDDLLERAYRESGKRVHVVIQEQDIAFMRNSQEDVNIVKLYGDLSQPKSLVLSREQYESFFINKEQIVKLLETELGRLNLLYLGWSYSDPHFNLIFGQILYRFGKFIRPGYAVISDLSEEQRREMERKQIHVFQFSGDKNYTEDIANWLNLLK